MSRRVSSMHGRSQKKEQMKRIYTLVRNFVNNSRALDKNIDRFRRSSSLQPQSQESLVDNKTRDIRIHI